MFKGRSLVIVGVALLTLSLGGVARAATQRQEVSGSRDDSTANIAVSWPMSTSAASMLVTVVSLRGTASTTITVPSGKGWTLANRADDGTVSVAIYYSQNAAAQSGSQTWGVSGGQPAVVHMIEYTGVATTAALDLSATNTGYGTAATVTASGTTAQAAELALVGVAIHRRPTLTMTGNDFTVVGDVTQTNGTTGTTGTRVSGGAFDNLYTGTTTPNATITFSTANARSWAAALVTFKIPSKYWIGCAGNAWTTNGCWSTASGGTANTTAPSTGDNVIFDGAGANGQNSPVFGTTTTVNAIDVKSTYTGTLSVASGKTLTINTDLSIGGGTFTAGGTLTFSTANLHVSGGTFNANGSAFAPTNVDVTGGTMTAGTGNLTIGGAYTQAGGTATMAGTTSVAEASTITGGTLTKSGSTKTLTFTLGLAISGGTLAHSQGTLTLSSTLAMSGTGALTVAATMSTGGAATMTGTSTITGSSGGAMTFSDFDMTGGTMTTGSASVTINNNVAISAGTFNNTGTSATVIDSTSTLTLSGTGAVAVSGGTFRVTRAVTMSGTSAFTTSGGATTFDTTLTVSAGAVTVSSGSMTLTGAVALNGGTMAVNGGTVTAAAAFTVDGCVYTTAGTSDLNSTLDVDSGSFTATAGTVDVAGAVTIAGGAYSGRGTFASTLAVSSGSITPNGGTIAVTGAVTVNGTGSYDGTGTSTFSNTLAVSAGTFDVDGGTVNVAGQVTISGTGTFNATNGNANFNRSSGTALSVTGGTIDANGGAISVPSNVVTISGGTFKTTTGSASFGSTVTVSSTGTYDASGGSSTAAGLVTVSGGTYKIGSGATGQTMSNGMTISGGILDGSSSTGVLKIAATKTLTVSSGTLQTSTGSTAGPTFDVSGAGVYFFTISGGTVSLNGGKIKGVSNVAGVNIGTGATLSQLDDVDFANIPASNPGSTQYLLSINQASLNLRSTGCKFDYNGATFSNLKTVRLTDSNTTVDVRAWFQAKDTTTNGAAAGDLYDADEDTSPDDGVGDTGNKAVVYWSYAVATDTAGAIQGVPTAAFDWNTGAYYSTYVTFRDIGGANTADRIYIRDANGEPVSTYDVANSDGNIVGTPLWTTESSVHVVYVATSGGKIYRLVDTNGTLALASSGSWTAAFTSATVVSITSPLIDDGTNLYFGGTTTASANRVFGVSKSAKTLVKNVTTTANVSAAPSWKINTATSTTYLFVGSAYLTNQAYLYRINMVPTGAVDATCCGTTGAGATTASIGSATRLVNSVLYAGDGNAKMHALDAMNLNSGGFINKTGWPYQDSNATRHTTVTVGAIQGTPYVDTTAGRLFYGDNDGHLYQLTTAGALVTNYPIKLTTTNQLRTSPLYLSGSGVVVIGDSGGNVYYVDVKNASSAPAVFYTTTLNGAVSSISYNGNTGKYMVGTASGILEMLPVKTDPTPTFVY
jgi:hypothetical protein